MQRFVVQQSWIHDSEFIGYYVADAQGYYAEADLEVVMRPGSAAVTPERTLLGGSADIALCAPESVAATIRDTEAELRIIGAQFQKSPLGIVSRADDRINHLSELAGRTLSVPDMNRPMIEELLAHAGLRPGAVELTAYTHDPALLIERRAAALVDFVVDPMFRLAEAGVAGHAILLFDLGAPLPNNLAVVTEETYRSRSHELQQWLSASRRGWHENYEDPTVYPRRLRGAPLVETRTLEHEIYANAAFRTMVESPDGILSMSEALIDNTRAYLARTGLSLSVDVFAIPS